MVYATDETRPRPVRACMVGGGRGGFIGAVHRMAMRLDESFVLVAGALSQDPDNARASAADIGLPEDRAYTDYEEMARREAEREDGAEAVVIVTPNHTHAPIATAFLEAGIDVICDKPMTTTLEDARRLVALTRERGRKFVVTHSYLGYAMVRQARAMVAEGDVGKVRAVHAIYIQDWLARRAEEAGLKQAVWRTDPARSGRSAALADIGVHAQTLAGFVTGLEVSEVCADLATLVPGRELDDNAHTMVRYQGGERGLVIASQIASGHLNDLSLSVFGDEGGLEWRGGDPEVLTHTRLGEPTRTLVRGGGDTHPVAARVSRMPARHPEGYIEGFANLYRDAAALIRAHRAGDPAPEGTELVPTVEDGALAMAFIEAAVDSSEAGGAWTEVPAV